MSLGLDFFNDNSEVNLTENLSLEGLWLHQRNNFFNLLCDLLYKLFFKDFIFPRVFILSDCYKLFVVHVDDALSREEFLCLVQVFIYTIQHL